MSTAVKTTRNTKQREIVYDAVCSLHNHPTPAQIFDYIHERNSNVSKATVYRNLKLLSERGDILDVRVPNAADRFDFRNDPHCHLVCTRCGGVSDVEIENLDVMGSIANDYGARIESYDLVFHGVCESCTSE